MVHPRTFHMLAILLLVATQATAQQVELLDFYLPTCAPCQAMAPAIDRLAAEGVPVRKIDGTQDPALAQQFRVNSYPTFVILVDGVESGRVVGATSHESLRSLITQAGGSRPVARPVSASSRNFDSHGHNSHRNFTVGPDAGPGMASAPRPRAQAQAPHQAVPQPVGGLIDKTVRLTVIDDSGRSHGAGTIIDARSGEALVVTCAHLFRDHAGQPINTEGRLTVEIFQQGPTGPQQVQRVPGSLVVHDFEADVALVRMRPTAAVQVAQVANSPGSIQAGNAVRSVGCDLGDDPSVRDSRIVSINRYNGPPNIETTGAPVQGRSGGGLFNDTGELIGICFAADNEANEGLYAGLASIHEQLDRIGMSELYQAAPAARAPLTVAMAPFSGVEAQSNGAASRESRLEPVAPLPDSTMRAQNVVRPDSMSLIERATLEEIARRGEQSEIVLLIRSNSPGSKTEVLTLDSASPAMVETLRLMSVRSGEN